MTYNSFRRSLGEPTGPRGPYKPKVDGMGPVRRSQRRILGDALTRSEQAKMLTAMEPEERKARIKLPALKFLDPARRLPWEPKT